MVEHQSQGCLLREVINIELGKQNFKVFLYGNKGKSTFILSKPHLHFNSYFY